MRQAQNFIELKENVDALVIPKVLAVIIKDVQTTKEKCSPGDKEAKHDYYSDQPAYEHYRHQATIK